MLSNLLRKIGFWYWRLKTFYNFKVYGPYGVSNCIEVMPYPYIIPILRLYGARIGEKCGIERGLILHRPNPQRPFKNLTIGERVYIGHSVIIDLTEPVSIGNHCAFGAACQLWTHTGDWTLTRADEHEQTGPLSIGAAVIIYSGSIVAQGVTIGNYARIGAGSVVLNNVEEKSFYAGNPARYISSRKF
jgi:acetyltransferase-like isoleucine patch superfamily enzyme